MEKRCSRIDGAGLLRLKSPMRDGTQGPLWRKWAWFVGLWAGGVLGTVGVGWLIRWWLQP